jgi:hypothetical protein
MRSWERLRQTARRGGVIVIVDDPTDAARGGPRYHAFGCPDLTKAYFDEKRGNGWKNGAYYWAPDVRAATDGAAVRCGNPRDPIHERSDAGGRHTGRA